MPDLNKVDPSIDLTSAHEHQDFSVLSKVAVAIMVIGFLILSIAVFGPGAKYPKLFLFSSFGAIAFGSLAYTFLTYFLSPSGVKNNHITTSALTAHGWLAWIMAVGLTGFYVIHYWWSHLFENWYRMMDPLSFYVRGKQTEDWIFYGVLYTFGVLIMGIRAIVKYRHSRYQIIRTCMVIFSQFFLAWLIPSLLVYFKEPEAYVNYFWPLSFKDGFPLHFQSLLQEPSIMAKFLIFWSLGLTFIGTPILTYYFGKRWYCSWVCGCGGLANTVGDPFRQNSSKKLISWKIERWMINSVLIFIVVSTGYIWYVAATAGTLKINPADHYLTKSYGFLIGMVFSGVVGTGFYPILGTRVWCRFGCPQAAILGFIQRFFSRFRITTNGGQCISCGNCSKYCEMGIDVRSYAERGANIVRASCVGCGMCATVCPRGVLNLENGPREGRINKPVSLSDIINFEEDK
ncbi:MAG: 4Fe-4S ferredoxin [Planctomycetota bacterium]|nr:MAG: 4Fe-4S ferredoxin [Planctomycetota bacterium]